MVGKMATLSETTDLVVMKGDGEGAVQEGRQNLGEDSKKQL